MLLYILLMYCSHKNNDIMLCAHKAEAIFTSAKVKECTAVIRVGWLRMVTWYLYAHGVCIFALYADQVSPHHSVSTRQKETMAMAILSLLPMAYWHEPRQSGTNNTWRAVQRQLGSVVRAGPINEWACGRGRGRGTAPAYVDAWETMHSDRSSPSPVLAWYKLIPACSHVVLQQQQHRIA